MPNGSSYRVIKDARHLLLINRLKWAYTSSANLSGEAYDESFAREQADVTIEPLSKNEMPSCIYAVNQKKIKKIR